MTCASARWRSRPRCSIGSSARWSSSGGCLAASRGGGRDEDPELEPFLAELKEVPRQQAAERSGAR